MTDQPLVERRRRTLQILMPSFPGPELPEWVDSLLRDGLGGVCLYADNIVDLDQLAALTASIRAANPQAILSIDEEGGDVSRLYQREGSPFPGNAVLGRLDDPALTRAVAHQVGTELAAVGINLALAPDADVNTNTANPVIGVRSFGTDPLVAANHTSAWVEGVQAAGVAACAKHFPGHGDTAADSHVSEPVVHADADTLNDRELLPFRAAIEAGTRTIMTSHIRVPALDSHNVATFSSSMLGDLLRGAMGFQGVVVTDALDMAGASAERGIPGAAVAAVAAGADLLCLGPAPSESEVHAVVDALADAAELPGTRLHDASDRCAELAAWMNANRYDPGDGVTSSTPGPIITAGQIASTFGLSDHARSVLADRNRPIRWVNLAPEQNVAIGATPFGPFHRGGAVATLDVPADDRSLADSYVDQPGALTVIVGRELHRDPCASQAAASIAARSLALIVDMGFTVGDGVDTADGVDIATFGASRLVGDALIELVEGRR
ncbi:MAG: glycoside hydrolase family 3 N-terminal domain-containing protein [Actinomycetota bacterium]